MLKALCLILPFIRLFMMLTTSNPLCFADRVNAQMPEDKNYMFSPLSIKTALAMAANGARGETKSEILNALGIDDLDAFNESAEAMGEKYSQSEVLKLQSANSLWINSDKTDKRFSEDYKNTIAAFYKGEARICNDKNAVSEVNGYVKEKTSGKIPTLISSPDFESMLLNAVYFKGAWQSEFNEKATHKAEFTDAHGVKSEMDFMNKTLWLDYAKVGEDEIVSLPYKAYGEGEERKGDIDVSMYIILSNEKNAAGIIDNASFERTYVDLSIPKFKIEYSTSLSGILSRLGIKRAFTGAAEFDDMFEGGAMQITDALHKTYINVDERGTEAAAVTAIMVGTTSLPPTPVRFNADKPFTFVIRDNVNGEVLFMGRVAEGK